MDRRHWTASQKYGKVLGREVRFGLRVEIHNKNPLTNKQYDFLTSNPLTLFYYTFLAVTCNAYYYSVCYAILGHAISLAYALS